MTASRSVADQKLGVLFVGTATQPPLGADAQVHARILSSLDPSKHDLHAACVRGTDGSPSPTFEALRHVPDLRLVFVDLGPELCIRTRWEKVRGLVATVPAAASLVRLAMYIRRNRIEILHTSDRPRDAAACVVLGRLTGAKSVIHCHNGYADWMSRLLKWALRRADARIGVSTSVARSFIDHGYDATSTFAVHNAIDIAEWHPGHGRDEARRELGIPATAPVVITVCRLLPAKGLVELIRAIAVVRHAQPDVRLVIVGRDISPDQSFSAEVTALVHDLGLERHVVFTGQRTDIARLMAASDVFAMPSIWEPFGLVYAEAMAMRLPVVALDSGGTPEVVDHELSGLLSKPGNEQGLADNLSRLLDDAELRAKMGEHGRRRVEARFTTDHLGDEIAGVFRLVTSRIGGSEVLEGGGACGRSRPLVSSRSNGH